MSQASTPQNTLPEGRQTSKSYSIGIAGPEIFILGEIPQHMPINDALELATELVVKASADPGKDFLPRLYASLKAKQGGLL